MEVAGRELKGFVVPQLDASVPEVEPFETLDAGR
jgi:hypothetical protein